MPHIAVKLAAGRSEAQKASLAAALTQTIIASIGCTEPEVTVSIEDIAKDDWVEQVYRPDILAKWEALYKKPGYDPLAAA